MDFTSIFLFTQSRVENHPYPSLESSSFMFESLSLNLQKDSDCSFVLVVGSNFLMNSRNIPIYYNAKILNIIIHFELKNFNLLKDEIRSLYRFLKQRDIFNTLEIILLEFFRKFDPTSSFKEQLNSFVALKEKILASKEESPKHSYRWFSVLDWATKRIEAQEK